MRKFLLLVELRNLAFFHHFVQICNNLLLATRRSFCRRICNKQNQQNQPTKSTKSTKQKQNHIDAPLRRTLSLALFSETSAIPAPINPAPTTPTVFTENKKIERNFCHFFFFFFWCFFLTFSFGSSKSVFLQRLRGKENAHQSLKTKNVKSQITHHKSQITNHKQITNHTSHITHQIMMKT
jgi:hypothetical protein